MDRFASFAHLESEFEEGVHFRVTRIDDSLPVGCG